MRSALLASIFLALHQRRREGDAVVQNSTTYQQLSVTAQLWYMIFLYFSFCHVPHRQRGKRDFPNQTYHHHNVFCFFSWHRRSGSALSGAFCWFLVHVSTSLLFVPATIHIHSRTYFHGDIFFYAFLPVSVKTSTFVARLQLLSGFLHVLQMCERDTFRTRGVRITDLHIVSGSFSSPLWKEISAVF